MDDRFPPASQASDPALRARLLNLLMAKKAEQWQEAPIERAEGDRDLPSFAQQRLWFLARVGGGASEAYHVPLGFRLRGRLDGAALKRALERIVQRHEILRTTFSVLDGEPRLRFGDADPGFDLGSDDLSDAADPQPGLDAVMAAEQARPFDLERGPLVRGRLVRLAADDHVLLVTLHHIVADGWSIGVLARELAALYRAYAEGGEDPLAPLPVQYADYAAWQRRWLSGEALARQGAYWRETLADAPALLELPTDRKRPEQQDYQGGYVPLELDADLTTKLKALGQRLGATPFMTVLAGWALVLSRLSGQDDVVIGAPVANRARAEVEGLIGFFVNTLALRIDLSGSPTAEDLLARVRTTVLAAQEHQDLPFEQVVELVRPVRSLAYTPVFQAILAWQDFEQGRFDLPGLAAEPVGRAPATSKFDLTLNLGEGGGRIVGGIEYATALFDRETVERIAGHLRRALEEMAADAARPAAALPLLSAEERRRILVEWNDTAAPYPQDRCLHQLFEAQVARTPDAPAVLHEGVTLSYAELNARANRLAHRLRALGVKPDDRVAICARHSAGLIAGLFGILKAGGAYVPLDPDFPTGRLALMLGDSAPVAALADGPARAALERALEMAAAGLAARLPVLDLEEGQAAGPDHDPQVPGLTSRNLAYIMYTSGSTGTPKGVMIEHANAVNLIEFGRRTTSARLLGRVLFSSSISFDMSVYQCFLPLACGGRVEVIEDVLALTRSPADPVLVCAVPSAMAMLVEEGAVPATARGIVLGGEFLKRPLVEAVFRTTGVEEIRNIYGPTETTTYSTCVHMDRRTGYVAGIGRPIANTRVYLLDARMEPVPVGAAGEIWIGGAGVARGYLNRPELTSQRFVASPFVDGDQLYRTGDLGRWLHDGSIEFLGRNDSQVKIRGFRIEPEEIEARLLAHPGVREAAVLVREDQPGDKRLVAYTTGEAEPSFLREYLSSVLPDYMVPAAYVRMEAFPATTSGKLDRRALPAPDGSAFAAQAYEAPAGPTEKALAAIWAEVLDVDRVGRHDNFFDLGGHSLLAVRVISKVRQALGVEVGLSALFGHPLLRDLAGIVADRLPPIPSAAPLAANPALRARLRNLLMAREAEQWQAAPIERAGDDRDLPSFAQQRLWFLSRMGGGASEAYHVAVGFRLRGVLDEAALKRALDRLVARHETLRTTFRVVDGEPFLCIGAAGQGLELRPEDLSSAADPEGALDAMMAEEEEEPFDLERGPLIRGRLVRLADEDHVLLVTMHHIVSDGWSMGVLLRELSALYRAYAEGGEDPLAPLPIQYADYAAWQRRWLSGEALGRQAAYWRQALADAPALLELPTDRKRPAQQDFAGAYVPLELDADLTAKLKALSRRSGATLFMTVLAGWALVLSRLSGQDDVVVGTPVANRTRAEIEGLIGFFVNTLALHLDLAGSPTVAELLARVRTAALGAQEHQDLPFEQVVELVKPARSLAYTPVFQVTFVWQNFERARVDLPGLTAEIVGRSPTTSKFDLTLGLGEAEGRIVGGIEYATALFERETVERYCGYLRRVLEEMAADAGRPAAALPLLPSAERHRLLVDWNAASTYPQERCLHALFEEQAARTPDAVAVTFEGHPLTYGELDARAERLARRLRATGVGPDRLVALCAERSPELVVGLLAILKAGGAYVPLDPAYPAERLAFILGDATPAAVVTHAPARAALEAAMAGLETLPPVLDLDGEGDEAGEDRPASGPTAGSLAYVIYTSGSTGTPKGVMVEHRQVVRLFAATAEDFGFGPDDVWTLFHSFAFDFSVWELWGALLHGGRLVVVPRETARSPSAFYRLLCAEGVTVLNQTPSAFGALATAQASQPGAHRLRVVVFGGEALDMSALRPWRRDARNGGTELVNMYGITETTVHVTHCRLRDAGPGVASPIGRRLRDLRLYLLDGRMEPVPVGVAGEIWVGGAGVARGYLNRPELTAERFVASPFVEGDRLYRSGDLGRWLPDGTIEFVGRNDFQVKVRGFRIEPGEIEAKLIEHPAVREAVVLAREDQPGDQRLVAYVIGEAEPAALRLHLASVLPEHMVPSAYVRLDALPLTPNGKLDHKALPAPDEDAFAVHAYEAPVGPVEEALARIWAEVLGLERVGRNDNFFDLGGHSLLAVRVLERMRRDGLQGDVRMLFAAPSLTDLASEVAVGEAAVEVPANRIPEGCTAITPDLLPLVQLGQDEIDRIVAAVPGGAANVQDVYPLAPLQEGILFHHLMAETGDAYLMRSLMSFADRGRLDAFAAALNAVIARHDILRTAVLWEELSEPVQVVWREAPLEVEEVALDPRAGDMVEQLRRRFDRAHYRLDVRHAPMMRLAVAHDPANGRWVALWLLHHLVEDATSLRLLTAEIGAFMAGRTASLPPPLPFRTFVAQARLGRSEEKDRAFFSAMLADVDEPTAPFGLMDIRSDGSASREARRRVEADLARRIRDAARALKVSPATLMHVAWGRVAALASGRRDPVFGTVLFGRMHAGAGADRAVGLFINALPVRLRLGATGVRDSVVRTHGLLGELMRHEHASAALAQRCSGVDPQVPLFTSLLNFRHGVLPSAWREETAEDAWAGIGYLGGEERTNFPLLMAVDDMGDVFDLSVQVPGAVGPERVCAMMHRVLEALVEALERDPSMPVGQLDVLPPDERHRLLVEWNDTATGHRHDRCIHELFEDQAAATPEATALVHGLRSMSYGELSARSNRLAHHLRSLGVGRGVMVGLHLERSPELVVGLLAILKAGGVYVPMDPAYPGERLEFMLEDARAEVIVTRSAHADALPGGSAHRVLLDRDEEAIGRRPATPPPGAVTPDDLAYVIYTSGSTGRPKGVLTTHAGVLNRSRMQEDIDPYFDGSRCAQKASIGFVDSVFEILCPLVRGKTVVIFAHEVTVDADAFVGALEEASIHHIVTVPSQAAAMLETGRLDRLAELRSWTLGGEELSPGLLQSIRRCLPRCRIINLYGCSEFTDAATTCIDPAVEAARVSIGRPVDNTRIYVLGPDLTPVPAGVAGELYLAGASLSRGYLNRPAFTAERYVACPFGPPGERMYRTGDLGLWRPDGSLESLGRADFQVKMRGFRIELGEIEARMLEHPAVKEAVVLAREDQPGDRRLVAYYTGEAESSALRGHLAAALPGHMVPAALVRMEAFPTTSSGKLSRKALPPPEGGAFATRAYEPPAGPVEEALAGIWAEILGVARVGRQDNFFDLGGHSLLATTVVATVRRRLGIGASLRSVFEAPTIAGFAARLEAGHRDVAFFGTSDGLRIAYQTWGDDRSGPPVVLQHGFATNAAFDWVFTGIVASLTSAGRRVVALDARGHGESDKPHSPALYGLHRSALDIRELLDHLGVHEADLVGFSMGAVAVLRAAAADARVGRLVLAGVGEGLLAGGGTEGEAFPVSDIVKALVEDEPDPTIDPDALWFRDLADRSGSDRIALAAHLSARTQGALALREVGVPTLIVAGEDDRLARRPDMLAAAMTDARVAMVPGNHRTTLAMPQLKARLVEFLCRS